MKKTNLEKNLDLLTEDFKVTGPGLWKQLDSDANKHYHNPITGEDIYRAFKEMIYKEEMLQIDELFEKELIEANQRDTLREMILTEDVESNELAGDLIKVIIKRDGDRIHST